MASQAQIDANRLNAQLSTGPKTEDGKQRSSENCFKHGFYAKAFIVRDDERDEFDQLTADIEADVPFFDSISRDLFAQLLHAAWNLHRLRKLENQLYTDCADPFADPDTTRRLDAIARHRVRFERVQKSLLQQLRDYYSNRYCHFGLPYEDQGEAPTLLDIHRVHRTRREMFRAYPQEAFLSPEEREAKAQEKRRKEEARTKSEEEFAKRFKVHSR